MLITQVNWRAKTAEALCGRVRVPEVHTILWYLTEGECFQISTFFNT